MTNNPYKNALASALYIIGIVLIMQYGMKAIAPSQSMLIPMAMLSLFVLSAAVMGYVFIGEPIQLYLDGKKEEAVRLFLKTVAAFACITALIFLAIFFKNLFRSDV